MLDQVFYFASIIGGLAFGFSGILIAIRKNLDIMGVFIVAMITANGGGVLRDVLVGKTPTVLIDMSGFLIISVLMILALIIRVDRLIHLKNKFLFVLTDSIGLVAFSITGSLVAFDSSLNIFGVMVLSFLTATGGGIIRDMFVNEIPEVLTSGFYGSVSILIALSLFILEYFNLLNLFSISIIFIASLALRLFAYFNDWHLPKLR